MLKLSDDEIFTIALNIDNYNILLSYCLSSKRFYKVCSNNKQQISRQLLKNNGYNVSKLRDYYLILKQFLAIDTSLKNTYKNEFFAFASKDSDLYDFLHDQELIDECNQCQDDTTDPVQCDYCLRQFCECCLEETEYDYICKDCS